MLPYSRISYRWVVLALLLSVSAFLFQPIMSWAHAQDHASAQHMRVAVQHKMTTPEDSVRATIRALFDGMRAGDSTAVRGVFHPDARLMTATAEGIRTTSISRFVEAVGSPREDVWDERTYDIQVRVDGVMATAWVPYAFYRGDAFSHCGVNAMQFVRSSSEWHILHLVDTRRSECDLPASVTDGSADE